MFGLIYSSMLLFDQLSCISIYSLNYFCANHGFCFYTRQSLSAGLSRGNTFDDSMVWKADHLWCPCPSESCREYFWEPWSSNGNFPFLVYFLFSRNCSVDVVFQDILYSGQDSAALLCFMLFKQVGPKWLRYFYLIA